MTFSGEYAAEKGQTVYYVTERCVFQLGSDGLELIEVSPGVDIERDILRLMEFQPVLRAPKQMEERILRHEPMDLRANPAWPKSV